MSYAYGFLSFYDNIILYKTTLFIYYVIKVSALLLYLHRLPVYYNVLIAYNKLESIEKG